MYIILGSDDEYLPVPLPEGEFQLGEEFELSLSDGEFRIY